jgi:hypothetical protein
MPTRRTHRSVRVLGALEYHLGGKQLPTVKDFISIGGLDSTDRHCYLSRIAGGRQKDSRESWAAAAKIVLATRDGLHGEIPARHAQTRRPQEVGARSISVHMPCVSCLAGCARHVDGETPYGGVHVATWCVGGADRVASTSEAPPPQYRTRPIPPESRVSIRSVRQG